MAEDPAISRFREYLRIKTIQPEPDYDGANKFLIKMAKLMDLPYDIIKMNDDPLREVFVMTWEGLDPKLPSIVLNSHIDVVPVFPDQWKYDPFEAVKEENGDIYARGAQDMKCVGMQYVEAILRMKTEGKRFPRTIHITWVPDEEIGGVFGMGKFVKTDHFKNLNGGFFLDEGLANPTEAFTVYYGERTIWWARVRCSGDPGHGSRFIENNAAEKLRKVICSFLAFRDSEERRLKLDPSLRLGDVTTVNMNCVEGGIQPNVVPAEFTATFDIRIAPNVDLKQFEAQIHQWCEEAGQGVTVEFLQKFEGAEPTSISNDNPWWRTFKSTCDELNMKIELEIFPAATDSRYIRQLGYNAIGFSPMNNTPILLHDHNEFLNEKIYLRGIDIYCKIIPAMASMAAT